MTNAKKAMARSSDSWWGHSRSGVRMVLVNVTGFRITAALQVAGVVCVFDVFGDLLGPVVRHGQMIK
jgi:purine-cytosine permease-like protein